MTRARIVNGVKFRKMDLFMHEIVDKWNIAILGDRWDTDNMPLFQFDWGGTIGGPGKIGMVRVVG